MNCICSAGEVSAVEDQGDFFFDISHRMYLSKIIAHNPFFCLFVYLFVRHISISTVILCSNTSSNLKDIINKQSTVKLLTSFINFFAHRQKTFLTQ